MKNEFTSGTKHEIYVGIKDKDSYQEILSVEDFHKILTEICEEKNIAFSLVKQIGGYQHNQGYTTETSLRIVVIGAAEEEIVELAERLKVLINTDAVLITRSEIEYAFL